MENLSSYSLSKKYFAIYPEEAKKKTQKEEYLKSIGFFEKPITNHISEGRINSQAIELAIANTEEVRFEVTERCNLSCKYCFYGDIYKVSESRGCQDLSLEYAFKLLDYLFDLWKSEKHKSFKRTITFTFYGGEPLLKVDFIKNVVNYIQNNNKGIIFPRFYIITNATLLKKNIDFLVKYGFYLLLSLDGNRTNNDYRVYKNNKPAFDEIIDNIDTLYKTEPEYFKEKVNFNSVLHNKNSVREILEYIFRRYSKNTTISELGFSNLDESNRDSFWNTYRNLDEDLGQIEDYRFIKDEFLPSLRKFQLFIKDYSNYIYNSYLSFFKPEIEKQIIPSGTCFPFKQKIFLTSRGLILPCEKISYDYILGYVDANGVNLNPEKVADKFNSYLERISKLCQNCLNLGACRQCMFFLNLEEKGIVCSGYKLRNEAHKNFRIEMFKKYRTDYKNILKTKYS